MDGIELMASVMHAEKTRLDISAANLANVSTDGFRRCVAHATLGKGGLTTWTALDGKPGPLRHTDRPLDLAVAGKGAFIVRDGRGRFFEERSLSFERDAGGHLADARGRLLMGEHGPLRVSASAIIDDRGGVREGGRLTDSVRVASGSEVRSGFLEAADTDAIHEMVAILEAQRAFETAQKTLSAIDDVRAKAAGQIAEVKS